jgi:hypothetical protein
MHINMGRKLEVIINIKKKMQPRNKRIVEDQPNKSQHQKKNHLVNVTINSDGGDNEKEKKNKFQDAIQRIPNMTFNPSLFISQGFPITRPETNPPLHDISNLIPDFNN